MKKQKLVKANNKEIILKADKGLFGRMALIAQARNLNMRDVLAHSLGPLPLEIANFDGSLRKTNKSVFAKEILKSATVIESVPMNGAIIIDGMYIVHKATGSFSTFAHAAQTIFSLVLNEGRSSSRIDVVFDTYRDISIKSWERQLRGSQNSVTYSNIVNGQKIQQWRKFLLSDKNKTALIEFLAKEWQSDSYRQQLQQKQLFISYQDICIKVTSAGMEDCPALHNNHEEADTKLLMHAKHAADDGITPVIIASEDTDVCILFTAYADVISEKGQVILKNHQKNRITFADIGSIQKVLGLDVCRALPALHAFTGCDSVSAFAGRGKIGAFKHVTASHTFTSLFSQLGEDWSISEQSYKDLEKFTCILYGARDLDDVNECRYRIFCCRKGDVEAHHIPPCRDALKKHIARASYQTAIW